MKQTKETRHSFLDAVVFHVLYNKCDAFTQYNLRRVNKRTLKLSHLDANPTKYPNMKLLESNERRKQLIGDDDNTVIMWSDLKSCKLRLVLKRLNSKYILLLKLDAKLHHISRTGGGKPGPMYESVVSWCLHDSMGAQNYKTTKHCNHRYTFNSMLPSILIMYAGANRLLIQIRALMHNRAFIDYHVSFLPRDKKRGLCPEKCHKCETETKKRANCGCVMCNTRAREIMLHRARKLDPKKLLLLKKPNHTFSYRRPF